MIETFRSSPYLVQKVWGGRKLETLFGKVLPDDRPYGESWEVADIAEGSSTVATGPHAGLTLTELVDRHGADLVGHAAPDGRFPLLVKLIDARDDLSIQVHPGPGHPSGRSKDECWIVLDSDPDGAIVHGFVEPTDPAAFRAAIEASRPLDLLRRVPVRPGDVFRIAPGTVHSIGAGVALLEIQQPSDTTYRLFDYGRPGIDGAPRTLHLEEALAVAQLHPSLPENRGRLDDDEARGWRVLANVDAYRVESLIPDNDITWAVSPHSAQVVHVLRGSCCLDDVLVEAGQTAVVPASAGRVWLTQPQLCDLVVSGLGGERLVNTARR